MMDKEVIKVITGVKEDVLQAMLNMGQELRSEMAEILGNIDAHTWSWVPVERNHILLRIQLGWTTSLRKDGCCNGTSVGDIRHRGENADA